MAVSPHPGQRGMAEPGIRRRRLLSARAAGESGRGPGARGAGRISPAARDLPGGWRWRRRLAGLLRERKHPLPCLPGILWLFGRPHPSFPRQRCGQTPRPRREGSGPTWKSGAVARGAAPKGEAGTRKPGARASALPQLTV